MKDFVQMAKARQIIINDERKPILVYTDAAEEGDMVTYGLVVNCDGDYTVAGGDVPGKLVSAWRAEGSQQTICQAELFPVLLVKEHFKHSLYNRRVVHFIDNDPAKHGLIKASSNSEHSQAIIKAFHKIEMHWPSVSWFARVPSASNIADAPSRGEVVQTANLIGGSVVLLHDLADSLAEALIRANK